MKAFIVERYGGGDALRLGDMPEPELRDDDVLVRVQAMRAYHAEGIPTSYVINQKGIIAAQNSRDIETIVNQLLAESPATNKPANPKSEGDH